MAELDFSISQIETQILRSERRWNSNREQITLAMEEIGTLRSGGKPNWHVLDSTSRFQRRLEGLKLHEDAAALADGAKLDFNPLERIINESQLTGIEYFERGMVAARTVARVNIIGFGGASSGFGTGFMISPKLFMTNNHVLGTEDQCRRSRIEFEYVNSVSGPRDPITFTLRPDQFFETNDPLDYTIVAVEETGSDDSLISERGWLPLIAGSGKATVGERVNIIQHPGGERMQIAVRDNTVVQARNTREFLHYVADTLPGSSGSFVCNDQWQLAALHHSGVPRRDENGNILLRNGQIFRRRADANKIDWIANEGIRISAIIADMRNANLTQSENNLWQQSFSPPPATDVWSLLSGGACELTEAKVRNRDQSDVKFETDENGNPSWLFRLSFGPASLERSTHNPSSSATRNPDGGSPSTVNSGPRSPSAESPIEAARRLFENFRGEGVYYDADEDNEMKAEYYAELNLDAPSTELYPRLQDLLERTHSPRHSYARARHQFLYPVIDLHEDGNLRNIYAGDVFDPIEAIATELATVQPVALARGLEADLGALDTLLDNDELWEAIELEESANLPFNCEHVVPQSWFDKRQPMKADIHHLFACRPNCNSFRSNIPYWQFPVEDEAFMEDCGRRDGTKFEPKAGKGPASRATMYFLARYPHLVGDETGELTRNRISVLLRWHEEFPVDEYERHRNWLTQRAQGNRNPFIDIPELATRALLEHGFGRR